MPPGGYRKVAEGDIKVVDYVEHQEGEHEEQQDKSVYNDEHEGKWVLQSSMGSKYGYYVGEQVDEGTFEDMKSAFHQAIQSIDF